VRESEAKYRVLFDSMNEAMAIDELLYDAQGNPCDWRILEVNPAYLRVSGRSREEVTGRRLSEVYGEAAPEPFLSRYGRLVETGEPLQFEQYFASTGMHLRVSAFPLGGARFVTLTTDVTALKQAQEHLLEAERTRARMAQTLADEIAHRTKNNLAIVAALLQTQLDHQAQRPLDPGLVRDAIARIHTFVVLHEQMYRTQSEEVELVSALRQMAELDRQALAARTATISVEGDPIRYPSRVGTNLCVVVNELVTNALKHSNSDPEAGRVEIRVWTHDGSLHVTVWNSGAPIAAGFEVAREAKTGLDLVHSLVEDQYGGIFRLIPEGGGTTAGVVIDDARLREG
jgi:PAS domain S-box-containing protein